VYDLIIVGGGPAGSAAGRVAGKQGLRTLLIEKAIFPRYKPCGGALSERAQSYLDFDLPEKVRERNVFGARIHYGGRVIERHKQYRISTLVSRSVLDHYLLDKARETGIDVKMGEKVVNCGEDDGCIEVYTDKGRYRARCVIVAEGAHGTLKYGVRKRDKKSQYAVAIVTEVDASNDQIDNYIRNAVDIHFGVTTMGYGWIFPHENYFSVGIAGLANRMASPRTTLTNFLRSSGFGGNYTLRAHVLPAGGIRRSIVNSRMLLTGDAAGFVDPFLGEGIAYAIRSGQIAAETVSDVLSHDKSPQTLKEYQSVCQSEFGANLSYSLILSRMMHRFSGVFFKILTSNKEAADKLLDVAASKMTYKAYLKWLIARVPRFLLHMTGKEPADSAPQRVPQEVNR